MINKDRGILSIQKQRSSPHHLPTNKSTAHSIMEGDNQICRPCSNIQNHRSHNYLLITLDGGILRGLFKHERLKPTNIRMSLGNVQNLAQLKQIMNAGLRFE